MYFIWWLDTVWGEPRWPKTPLMTLFIHVLVCVCVDSFSLLRRQALGKTNYQTKLQGLFRPNHTAPHCNTLKGPNLTKRTHALLVERKKERKKEWIQKRKEIGREDLLVLDWLPKFWQLTGDVGEYFGNQLRKQLSMHLGVTCSHVSCAYE